MENQDNNSQGKRGRVLGGVASVLNAGGSALVYAYDAGGGAMGKLYSVLKKTPGAPAKAFDKVVGSLGFLKPGETRKLQEKIGRYNKKIKKLYYEIGKVSLFFCYSARFFPEVYGSHTVSKTRGFQQLYQKLLPVLPGFF